MLKQVTEAVLVKELNPELNTKDELGNSNALRERRSISTRWIFQTWTKRSLWDHKNWNYLSLRKLPKGSEDSEESKENVSVLLIIVLETQFRYVATEIQFVL